MSLFPTLIKLSNVFWPYFELIQVTNAGIDRSKWQRPFTKGKYASRQKVKPGRKKYNIFRTEEESTPHVADHTSDLSQNSFCVS